MVNFNYIEALRIIAKIMGKIDLKTLKVSGRLGPVVTYATKSGKQVYRKYIVPNDPKTPKQLAYR